MSDTLVLTSPSQRADSMLTVIERALLSPDFDVAKLHQLLELRERYEAAEAKKAYVAAKARFASLDVSVTKDKTNRQYDSRYTSLGNMVNTVRPKLGSCGLEASWRIAQNIDGKNVRVTCILTHEQGHFEEVSMDIPPDTSGQKNPIQQIKSAITYARNLTFESICGLASTDKTVNADDDGNGFAANSTQTEEVPEDCVVMRLDAISAAANDEELKQFYLVALREAQAVNDRGAQDAYGKAKNKRYRELHGRP